MKRIIPIILASVLLLVVLSGCTGMPARDYEEITGIDLASQEPVSVYDTHGFHGDGVKCMIYDCTDTNVENIIRKSHVWKETPFSHNVETLLYGTEDAGPYLKDDRDNTFVPLIKNGFYAFYDRHDDAKNPRDDTEALNVSKRYSFNLSLAVYDADNQKLYYLELDT